jgi:hypothetical protein
MAVPYLLRELKPTEAKAMVALLLESRNVDVLKISKDIAASFKHGRNYGLFVGGNLIGVSGVIDTPAIASLSYLYLNPAYRMKKICLEFTYKVIESIEADLVYVKSRNISTFRSLVEKEGDKYRFKKREFLEKIMSRINIDSLEG